MTRISFFGDKTFLAGATMTIFLDKIQFFSSSRNDDDREINHHGRPVEVGGEQSSRAGSSVQKVFVKD